jgi:hypothetical protein
MKKVFAKFGFELKDPITGVQLNIPNSFKSTYDYKLKSVVGNLNEIMDETLRRATKLTSTLPTKCVICDSTNQVEMHHLRRVADVWAKFRTGNAT